MSHEISTCSSVYVPPSHSAYGRVEHFHEIESFLLQYSGEDFCHILCGDFNSHTSTSSDILAVPDVGEHVGFDEPLLILNELGIETVRTNEDLSNDRSTYGKKLLDLCKNHKIVIYNGRLGEDKGIGKATTTFPDNYGLCYRLTSFNERC